MSAITKGQQGIWGIDPSIVTGVSGFLKSAASKKDGEKDFIHDSLTGGTIGVIYYDNKAEMTLNTLFKETGTAVPARGDSITIDGQEGCVESTEVKWVERGWKELSITAVFYEEMQVS